MNPQTLKTLIYSAITIISTGGFLAIIPAESRWEVALALFGLACMVGMTAGISLLCVHLSTPWIQGKGKDKDD